MEKYRVQRISGGSMDELESNLRTFLNGLSNEEECISLSLGLKEALIVTVKGSKPIVQPQPAPIPVAPPAPAPQPVFNIPVQQPQTTPEPVPRPAPAAQPPAPQAPAPEAPKTVQFIPKVENPTHDVEEVVDVESEGAPGGQVPPQRPNLIFRKCSFCNNQLIVPHVPISVMCPHCKSTVSIDE